MADSEIISIKRTDASLQVKFKNSDLNRVMRFNAPETLDFLKRFLHANSKLPDANYQQLLIFLVHNLNQIRETADFFKETVCVALEIICCNEASEECREVLFPSKDDGDYKPLYSFMRVFLLTHRQIKDNEGYKHRWYELVFEILIKFVTPATLTDLLAYDIFDTIFATIRFVVDDGKTDGEYKATFEHLMYLLFRVSMLNNYNQVEHDVLMNIKLMLIQYIEKQEVYSRWTVFSGLLCLCNSLPINNSSKITEKLSEAFMQRITQLIDDLVFKNEEQQSIKLVYTELHEVDVKCFDLYDVYYSLRNFFKHADSIGCKFLELQSKFQTLEAQLKGKNEEKYKKWKGKALKNVSFPSSNDETPDTDMDVEYDYKTYVDEVISVFNRTTTGYLKIQKLNMFFLQCKNVNEMNLQDLVKILVKCLNMSSENSEKMYLSSSKVDYLKIFVEIAEFMVTGNTSLDLILVFISKIYIRRYILDSSVSKSYEIRVKNLFKKVMGIENKIFHAATEVLRVYEAFFDLEKFNLKMIKNLVFVIQTVNSKATPMDDLFVLNLIEIYEFMGSVLDRQIDNTLVKDLRTEIFDKKIFNMISRNLRGAYDLYNQNERVEHLLELKTLLGLALGLFKNVTLSELENLNEFVTFFVNFKVNENQYCKLDMIVYQILSVLSIEKQKEDKKGLEVIEIGRSMNSFNEAWSKKRKVDFNRLVRILTDKKLREYLDEAAGNMEMLKQLLKGVEQGLAGFYAGSEEFYVSEKKDIDIVSCFLDLVRLLAKIEKPLRNEIIVTLFRIIFKTQLRQELFGSQVKIMSQWALAEIDAQKNRSKESGSLSIMQSYFEQKSNLQLNKSLVLYIHVSSDPTLFEHTFEVYQYYSHYISSSEAASNDFVYEFFDRRCFEVLTRDFVRHCDEYRASQQLDKLFSMKAALDLSLNLLKKTQFSHITHFANMCGNVMVDFVPIENSYFNLKPVVDEILALYMKVSSEVTSPRVAKQYNEKSKERKAASLEEALRGLVNMIEAESLVNIRIDLVLHGLDEFNKNAQIFDDALVKRFDELNISKMFYHIARSYYELCKVDPATISREDFHETLIKSFTLMQRLCHFSDFRVNGYLHTNADDSLIDTLDVLIHSILRDQLLILTESRKTVRIIQSFMQLILALSSSVGSSEILKFKFDKFNVYLDLLQNLPLFKRCNCSNSVFILLANTIDKKAYGKLAFNNIGIVNNSVVNLLKVFLRNFVNSIYDALGVKRRIDVKGALQYELVTDDDGAVEDFEDFSLAVDSLANFIEVDNMHLKYLCNLCIDEVIYYRMIVNLMLSSVVNEERLAAVRLIWLLVNDKAIAKKVKNDAMLMEFLTENSNTSSSVQIRTFCGAILWNVASKLEPKRKKVKRDRNDATNDEQQSSESDVDASFMKLSIQATPEDDT